jgi:hypothetical protein
MLNFELAPDKKFEEVDGGLLIRNVTILDEGTWTDSYAQTPCHYSADVLREHAANWRANGYWLRHQGGSPRSIDDKVGEVRSPRFEGSAVMGDVFLHLASGKSRDHAEMVKRGLADAVSAELATLDEWDESTKVFHARYIEFSGLASVDRGACETCRIRGHEDAPSENETMDAAELDKKLEAFKADLLGEMGKELDKRLAALAPAAKPEELKGLSEKLDAAQKELAGYAERLEKIESAPDPKTFEGEGMEKELEMPANLPNITKGSIEIG